MSLLTNIVSTVSKIYPNSIIALESAVNFSGHVMIYENNAVKMIIPKGKIFHKYAKRVCKSGKSIAVVTNTFYLNGGGIILISTHKQHNNETN